jgi:hypothetical protein
MRTHEDRFSFTAFDFPKLGEFSVPVVSLDLRDPLNSDRQKLADGKEWDCSAGGEKTEQFNSPERVARAVGVKGRKGPAMTGVERLEQLEHLRAATFAEDNPIGAHAERLSQQGS